VAFAREGAAVVVDYVGHPEAAQETVREIEAAGGKAIAVQADVTEQGDVRALVHACVAEFSRLDILGNNAGVEHKIPFLETPGQLIAALALVGAAASGALSSFVVELWYKDKGIPASTTSLFALSVGAMLTLPAAVVTASRELPGVTAVLAVLTLGLLCTALAYMLYYRLVDRIGGERASLANYLTPAFALLCGVLLLGETLTI